jgi:hypothetical protein
VVGPPRGCRCRPLHPRWWRLGRARRKHALRRVPRQAAASGHGLLPRPARGRDCCGGEGACCGGRPPSSCTNPSRRRSLLPPRHFRLLPAAPAAHSWRGHALHVLTEALLEPIEQAGAPHVLVRGSLRLPLAREAFGNSSTRSSAPTQSPLFHPRWAGLDGSRVLAHFAPADNYNAQADVADVVKSAASNKDKGRTAQSIMLYGVGDGGGGPNPPMFEQLRRLGARPLDPGAPAVAAASALRRDVAPPYAPPPPASAACRPFTRLPGLPDVVHGTPRQFFDALAADLARWDAVTWRGEDSLRRLCRVIIEDAISHTQHPYGLQASYFWSYTVAR